MRILKATPDQFGDQKWSPWIRLAGKTSPPDQICPPELFLPDQICLPKTFPPDQIWLSSLGCSCRLCMVWVGGLVWLPKLIPGKEEKPWSTCCPQTVLALRVCDMQEGSIYFYFVTSLALPRPPFYIVASVDLLGVFLHPIPGSTVVTQPPLWPRPLSGPTNRSGEDVHEAARSQQLSSPCQRGTQTHSTTPTIW